MDKITCIVTTYNRPISVLKRALDSIVNQTYSNLEIVVVNDAPHLIELEEKIRNMICEYENFKIKYVKHSENMGACGARNTGLEHATGQYVAFLDDDDEWLPIKLEKQYQLITKEDVALVYCSHYETDGKNEYKLVEESFAREGIQKDDWGRLLMENFVGSTSYPLIDIKAINHVGGFNLELKSSQDHELWIRIAKKYKILYCREPLVIYYNSKESISSNPHNRLQGFEYLLEKYKDFYYSNNQLYNYRLNYISYSFLKDKHYRLFIKYFLKALMIKPFSRYNFMIGMKIIKKLGLS
ncbi:glycosyltransferase family 2 protein [Priestia koreensis]|uniref:Glycosyltransferase 2-like domain-containing protein n=1 Tax=Priestia koreensis TaxID=284581 RepID=A0A0M0LHG6_9BACI|nr:glycosyltransferase family 2 protein [Priestia koreensis]KOO50426.1 hypothetical protein AMD01_01325 [Priestia koreensis]